MIEGSEIEPKAIVAVRDELKEQRGEVVSFDLDGTLIDSRADLAAAVNTVRAEQGLRCVNGGASEIIYWKWDS